MVKINSLETPKYNNPSGQNMGHIFPWNSGFSWSYNNNQMNLLASAGVWVCLYAIASATVRLPVILHASSNWTFHFRVMLHNLLEENRSCQIEIVRVRFVSDTCLRLSCIPTVLESITLITLGFLLPHIMMNASMYGF